MDARPHSELHEVLIGLNERLPAGPWFYEPGLPEGGDRTGSVWARYGDTLDLVMSKPNVATAERLVVLRNALPEIIGLFEQFEALERKVLWYEDGLRQAERDFIALGLRGLAERVRLRYEPKVSSPARVREGEQTLGAGSDGSQGTDPSPSQAPAEFPASESDG